MITALLAFLGGNVFRMIFGEVIAYLNKRQDHLQELDRMREEAGIEAASWSHLLEMDLSNSASDEQAIIYVAQELTFHEPEPEHNEELALCKVPFDELFRMVMAGEVRDSLTVAAVLKVKLLMDQGVL